MWAFQHGTVDRIWDRTDKTSGTVAHFQKTQPTKLACLLLAPIGSVIGSSRKQRPKHCDSAKSLLWLRLAVCMLSSLLAGADSTAQPVPYVSPPIQVSDHASYSMPSGPISTRSFGDNPLTNQTALHFPANYPFSSTPSSSNFYQDEPTGSNLNADGGVETDLNELHEKIKATEKKIADFEKAKKDADEAKANLPSLTVNGVFQADWVAFNQTDASRLAYGSIQTGSDFRRARLSAKGAVTPDMDYFMQMDFGFFGRPTFTDLWVDFKNIGSLGNVRVGQWKQPFSLEVVSSFRYTTFMERAGAFQAFTPFRHMGLGFYDHADDLFSTWALSYIRTGQDQFGGSLSSNGGNGMVGRITRLLWYDEQCNDHYLHTGFSYYLNSPPNDRVRYRSIPEIFVGEFVVPTGVPNGTSGQPIPSVANGTPFFVDTGVLPGTRLTNTLGVEKLWVDGPWSWQSEYMGSFIDSTIVGNRLLHGGYSQVSFFLTGENRPYDRKLGQIDRVIPHDNFQWCGGPGAWEIAARWSYLDLTDGPVLGGEMQNMTLGLNWYVNPNCKCVFNYIHSWATSRPFRNGVILSEDFISSQTDAFAMRCQIDF
jgi:phosphate-selective porin OprO and OprP